jgi:hypothetical protein
MKAHLTYWFRHPDKCLFPPSFSITMMNKNQSAIVIYYSYVSNGSSSLTLEHLVMWEESLIKETRTLLLQSMSLEIRKLILSPCCLRFVDLVKDGL